MTSPSDELTADEFELIRLAYLGPTRFVRVCANSQLADRRAAGQLGAQARRLLGILTGPAHKLRRARAGRRLAFSFAYLIATRPAVVEFIRPAGRGRALVRNVSGRDIERGELAYLAPARPKAGPPAGGPTTA